MNRSDWKDENARARVYEQKVARMVSRAAATPEPPTHRRAGLSDYTMAELEAEIRGRVGAESGPTDEHIMGEHYGNEGYDEAAADLLTDLRHHCTRTGVNFEAAMRASYGHWLHERPEAAPPALPGWDAAGDPQ